ncbi:MAG: glycosyltransferase [Thermoanaerobaculia bacterium]
MRLAYLLDRPELGGGPKVVFEHAALLAARGHEVAVAGRGREPVWSGGRVPYIDLSRGGALPARLDLLVATWWTTINEALASDALAVAHFCQGIELDLEHLAPQAAAIRDAYSRPLPALVVAPHLGGRLGVEFGREARLAPPALALPWLRPRLGPRRHPTIALFGIFAAAVKGVRTGLSAAGRLRAGGLDVRLLRIATLARCAEETELASVGRYLEAVSPEAALAALARADLLLFPSTAAEGFGLPLLEAMGIGVPAVASRTPGTEFITEGGAGAVLCRPGDADELAAAAQSILTSSDVWRRQRRAGRRAARRFAPEVVAGELESAILWARESGTRPKR